jgi:hypothetical protein
LNTVSKAKMYPVTVKAWNGKKQVWYTNINKFSLLPAGMAPIAETLSI